MLEKNFEGKHCWVPVQNSSIKIDAMFFPASSDKVLIDKELESLKVKPEYISKPTMIICNPNALFYHHMVNFPNAFWLNFFLKKGINVMAWNYRGYGATEGIPSPYNIKTDGEAILNYLLKTLRVQGKIGIYGRSLGGVVATHIAGNFPDLISLVFADRTFGNLKAISKRKFYSEASSSLFNFITMKWETNNDINYAKVSKLVFNIILII